MLNFLGVLALASASAIAGASAFAGTGIAASGLRSEAGLTGTGTGLIHVQLSETPQQRVWSVLRLGELMPVLRDEARREAEQMEEDGLAGPDGLDWADVVAVIHDPTRLEAIFLEALSEPAARAEPAVLDAALAFFETGPGARLVLLETEARRAMLDPDLEDAARDAFARADRAGNARVDLIRRLIDEGDLLAPNVATGMNASVAFSEGFAEGGGFAMAPSPEEMLAEAWGQQDEIEFEANAWMEAFLFLAYAPASDAEIEAYIAFAASPGGRLLADLLFIGFDRLFVQTSREMGWAAAQGGTSRQL